VLDPRRSKTVYAGTPTGVYKSTDGGASWRRAGLKDDSVSALAIAPNGGVLYAGAAILAGLGAGGVFRGIDGGARWLSAGLDGRDVVALALDPRRPTTIYTGTDDGVFKSTDGGVSWQRLNRLTVDTLAVDPRRPTIVYAGTSAGYASTSAGVFKSTDGGVLWRYVGLKSPRPVLYGYPATLGVWDFAFGPKTVYAATDGGVFRSTNEGKTWQLVGAGGSQVDAVAVSASGRVLYAGTSGGGVYRLRLGG
jgi:photosystem II stability/assembly factor-like uncharacterized protein